MTFFFFFFFWGGGGGGGGGGVFVLTTISLHDPGQSCFLIDFATRTMQSRYDSTPIYGSTSESSFLIKKRLRMNITKRTLFLALQLGSFNHVTTYT